MITEIFREPDAGLILGLTRGTFYSIFMIIAGTIVIRRSKSLK
jgi:phosphatidylglycerol:prolipoprotein diacylglycerol transferase